MRPINGQPCHEPKMPQPDLVRCSGIIPWYLPEVFNIVGIDIIAQVAKTCYHPVTETLGNCISITGYHKPNQLLHFLATSWHIRTRTLNSSVLFQQPRVTVSPVGLCLLLKGTPESRTFANIIYEPHVWVEEVVFLLRF
jgi:hypothetical protein